MRLSEAMMLGGIANTIDCDCWDGCLLGVSVKALGANQNKFNREAQTRWPWIEDKFAEPKIMADWYGDGHETASVILSNLAVMVVAGRVTLEQVVDWVRSVEPAESDQEQTCEGEGTRASLTKSCAL